MVPKPPSQVEEKEEDYKRVPYTWGVNADGGIVSIRFDERPVMFPLPDRQPLVDHVTNGNTTQRQSSYISSFTQTRLLWLDYYLSRIVCAINS